MTSRGIRIFVTMGLLILFGMSCNNTNNQSNLQLSEKVSSPAQLELPYEVDYLTIDSTRLSIKVYALPSLFDLKSMQGVAKEIEADGKFIEYGIDKVYQVRKSNLDLKFCEANEVGFRKRYEHFIVARIGLGYTLDCGLTIGDPARLLVESKSSEELTKQKSIRYDKLSEVQFYDHWGIYTHTYQIKDGMIQSLEIAF